MTFVSKLLGAATLVCAFSSSVHAETLANANAFACGVDGPTAYSNEAATMRASGYAPSAYPGAGLDREMPSMVKLRIIYEHADRIEIDHCGGTVIDRNWVVTAAHCVAADSSWDRVEVLAGDTNLDGGNVIRRVSRNAVCHSGFEFDGLKDDVALIRLEEPLPYEITPAHVDQQNATSVRAGSTAIAAGWPVTGAKAGDRRLNKTQVSIVDAQVPGYITAVSAYGSNEGVCRGESGGPLMAYGPLGLQLAGVLSGIQPGTENGSGEECMLAGYEMYFTPMAAFRGWMDTVRGMCDRNPALCSGSGARGMMLAAAPSYSGPASVFNAAPVQQPVYTATAQPSYVPVAQAHPTYVPVAQTQPTYVPIAQPQPTYIPVAEIQPTYIDVTPQQNYSVAYAEPVYQDVTATYQDVTPTYQDVTYQVALNDVAPAATFGGNYVDLGYVDMTNSYSPPVAQYQEYSFQPAQPTYIEATPQYEHVGAYNTASVATYVNVGSGYRLHAW